MPCQYPVTTVVIISKVYTITTPIVLSDMLCELAILTN